MTKTLLKNSLGWGFVLWFVGYVLGLALFAVISTNLIGWAILPIGAAITVWVAFTRLALPRFSSYVVVAAVWTAIAIVLDYLLLVKLFNPPDGYYKLDVYLYYALTFAIPSSVGWWKMSHASRPRASHGAQAA